MFLASGDKIEQKGSPLESSLDFLNYENTIEHSLIQARKIHESVLYQAFFCFFFDLVNTEERP